MYKYHTPAEYHALILETEAEIEEKSRLEQIQQWAANPANAAQVAHIRSELDRVAPQRQPASPRPTAQATQAGKLPAIINGGARFYPSHLKMKPATPQIDAVGDPYVFSPKSNVRMR